MASTVGQNFAVEFDEWAFMSVLKQKYGFSIQWHLRKALEEHMKVQKSMYAPEWEETQKKIEEGDIMHPNEADRAA